MRFELPVQVSSWVKRTGSEPQQRVDAFVTKLRRGDSELGRMGHRNIAAQSDKMIAKKLIEICERIAAMPHLSTELAEELIRIEALATFLDRR